MTVVHKTTDTGNEGNHPTYALFSSLVRQSFLKHTVPYSVSPNLCNWFHINHIRD